MEIRLAAYLQPDSIVDGEGIRTVIWTQGCPHHCLGCHNPETHDFEGGALVDLEEVYEIIDSLEGQDGITFSGGDPFMQPKPCSMIAKYAKNKGYNIWCYTGYTFEQLLTLAETKKEVMDFLKEIDVLIDGRFELAKKSYNALFRGSTNQRIIDVKKSLKKKKVVLADKYNHEDNHNGRKRQSGIYI
jgi:anaerobic ribonucleoside-triphosphate reductase activating protein